MLNKKNLYLVDNNEFPTKAFAVVTYDENAGYTLSKSQDFSYLPLTISTHMESNTAILNLEMPTVVTFPEVNKTFTLNGRQFTPTGSTNKVIILYYDEEFRYISGDLRITNSGLFMSIRNDAKLDVEGTIKLSKIDGTTSVTELDEGETVRYTVGYLTDTYENVGDGFIVKNGTKIFVDGSSDTDILSLSDDDAFTYLQSTGTTLTLPLQAATIFTALIQLSTSQLFRGYLLEVTGNIPR